jgi:hypothetical protein
VEANVLLAGEIPVEAGPLEDDSDSPPHGTRLANDIAAADRRRPARRGEGRCQDRDRRGLPGAVRAEQREELARIDVERDAIDGVALRLPVALDQRLDVDHESTSWPIPAPGTPGSAAASAAQAEETGLS